MILKGPESSGGTNRGSPVKSRTFRPVPPIATNRICPQPKPDLVTLSIEKSVVTTQEPAAGSGTGVCTTRTPGVVWYSHYFEGRRDGGWRRVVKDGDASLRNSQFLAQHEKLHANATCCCTTTHPAPCQNKERKTSSFTHQRHTKAFEQQEDLLVSAQDKGALTAAPGAIRVEMPPQFPKGCLNSSSCCFKAAVERRYVTTLPRAVGANTGYRRTGR